MAKPYLTVTPTKQTRRGLGWRHQRARETLLRQHKDGTLCDWCGRPMYRDRRRNWDYHPERNHLSGVLHADHRGISRTEALRRGQAIPLPDRLLHGVCNIQRGEGGNDHLADAAQGEPDVGKLAMDWP